MKRPLLPLVLLPIFLLCAAQGNGQTRTISYQWLNQPCAEIINCEGGCSACNLPAPGDQVVFGTNAAMIGVEACPFPVSVGDNALWLSGWSAAPGYEHRIVISGIAQVSLRIDSVIIVHRREANGPARLLARVHDQGDGSGGMKDVSTTESFEATVITDAGVVEKSDASGLASFHLQLQAYDGSDGAWVLDEVRIVATVIEDISTAIISLEGPPTMRASSTIDLLGRAAHATKGDLRFRAGDTMIVQ